MEINEKEHGVLQYRLDELEQWRKEHIEWRRRVDEDRGSLKYMRKDISDLTASFDGLRRTLLAFAFVIAAGSVTFALTVLSATGKI